MLSYLEGVKIGDIIIKLQKPLLTRWWHSNTCVMQVVTSYSGLVRLFEDVKNGRHTQIVVSIDRKGVDLV